MKRKSLYYILPIMGAIFCIWYLQSAVVDVVYTDYIRLINQYLPDVWNPDKFFVADVLTRIPINYVGRILNTILFDYSTMFDMMMGILGLLITGLLLGRYCIQKKIGLCFYSLMMVVMFSLNKWEMLTNGTGYAHFLAFACFYWHYTVLDRVWAGQERRYDNVLLRIIPIITTLGVAGPYCAIYSVVLLLTYGGCMLYRYWVNRRWEKAYLVYGAFVLLPLILYIVSNSFAVEDHAGAVTTPLWQTLAETPSFFIRFFIKSFSSMVFGGEVAETMFSSNLPYFILGLVVVGGYLMGLWLYVRFRLYEKTLLPLIFMVSGGLNHLLILVSRWIFLNENYGMSSRYALQYQIGILGMLLTFALVIPHLKQKRLITNVVILCFCGLFLFGNVYTSYQEIQKAPYRKEAFEKRRQVALHFEEVSDEVLRESFDYRKSRPDTPDRIREALSILKEQKWNVFRE